MDEDTTGPWNVIDLTGRCRYLARDYQDAQEIALEVRYLHSRMGTMRTTVGVMAEDDMTKDMLALPIRDYAIVQQSLEVMV